MGVKKHSEVGTAVFPPERKWRKKKKSFFTSEGQRLSLLHSLKSIIHEDGRRLIVVLRQEKHKVFKRKKLCSTSLFKFVIKTHRTSFNNVYDTKTLKNLNTSDRKAYDNYSCEYCLRKQVQMYFNLALTPKDITTPVPLYLEGASAFVWEHNEQDQTQSKSHRSRWERKRKQSRFKLELVKTQSMKAWHANHSKTSAKSSPKLPVKAYLKWQIFKSKQQTL